MDEDKKPVTFNRAGAKRIAEAVKYVEKLPRNTLPQRGRPPAGNLSGVRLAKSQAGGIAAVSSLTPGTGSVELYGYSGPGTAAFPTGVIVTVSNIGAAIAASKLCYVAEGDGGWHVVVVPC
jgi:hypothetical protein